MLKTFAVLLLVTTGMLTFASAKAAVSCQAVADEVGRKGADATVRDLTSRTNGDWDQFIRQVGAGRAECVQAAAAVAPAADAGNHEGIIYGLSQALRENPKAVLMVSGGRISLENICSDALSKTPTRSTRRLCNAPPPRWRKSANRRYG